MCDNVLLRFALRCSYFASNSIKFGWQTWNLCGSITTNHTKPYVKWLIQYVSKRIYSNYLRYFNALFANFFSLDFIHFFLFLTYTNQSSHRVLHTDGLYFMRFFGNNIVHALLCLHCWRSFLDSQNVLLLFFFSPSQNLTVLHIFNGRWYAYRTHIKKPK